LFLGDKGNVSATQAKKPDAKCLTCIVKSGVSSPVQPAASTKAKPSPAGRGKK